jgi:hypothetical protein
MKIADDRGAKKLEELLTHLQQARKFPNHKVYSTTYPTTTLGERAASQVKKLQSEGFENEYEAWKALVVYWRNSAQEFQRKG